MKARTWTPLLAAIALLAGACGRTTGPGNGGIDHPTGAHQLVLRVDVGGGFIAPDYSLRQIPRFSLFGDGTLITQGPQMEIYPGPALPALIATPISEEGVQAILEATRGAGLFGPNRHYDFPCIADVGTTTFTLNAEAEHHVVSAYALSEGQSDCPGVDTGARAKLARFQAKLGDLRSWLPEGSVGQDGQYAFTELRVYVRPYTGDPTLSEREVAWPLTTPLADFGQAVANLPDTRCGVVGGDELATLLPDVRSANELTPWTSEGRSYGLLFRPLLPDEHGC